MNDELYRYKSYNDCGHLGCDEADIQMAESYGMVPVEPDGTLTVNDSLAAHLGLPPGDYLLVRRDDA